MVCRSWDAVPVFLDVRDAVSFSAGSSGSATWTALNAVEQDTAVNGLRPRPPRPTTAELPLRGLLGRVDAHRTRHGEE